MSTVQAWKRPGNIPQVLPYYSSILFIMVVVQWLLIIFNCTGKLRKEIRPCFELTKAAALSCHSIKDYVVYDVITYIGYHPIFYTRITDWIPWTDMITVGVHVIPSAANCFYSKPTESVIWKPDTLLQCKP